MTEVKWKTGFEIELLAPKGKKRLDLAKAIAEKHGGHVKRIFYPQSEPSAVPGTPVFENLVLGFDVINAEGNLVARLVDDITIQADLDREAPGLDGWYRILSDDIRLLRLVMAQCNPDSDLREVLEPVAALFGTELNRDDSDVVRLTDNMNMPVALAASLPGERERPCEIITPPYLDHHHERLDELLSMAASLGFTVPKEAAVHIHFDGTELCDVAVFTRLVTVLKLHGKALRKLVGTNPNCVRLGPIPAWLFRIVKDKSVQSLSWEEFSSELRERELTKYCDFNFMNFVYGLPGKSTFEVRIFPGSGDALEIIEEAALFEGILNWCVETKGAGQPARKIGQFIEELPLAEEVKRKWQVR